MQIFLSYAWNDKPLADTIDEVFNARGIHLIRDERDLNYKQNIKEFMKQIGNADFALLLVSDSFLKSSNCMFEVMELFSSRDFKHKVLPIINKDAHIFSPEGRLEYINYWDKKASGLEAAFRKSVSIAHSDSIYQDLNHYNTIRTSIDSFLDHLKSHVHESFEKNREVHFAPIINYIKSPKKKFESKTHFLRHPKSLFILSALTILVNFNYYGLLTKLFPYLGSVSSVTDVGYFLEKLNSQVYYNLKLGIMTCLLFGGILSDYKLGQKKAIIVGASTLIFGYWILSLGTYHFLLFGLAGIAIGTGFIKQNIPVLIGELYLENDRLRNIGFSIYYISINLGAFLGNQIINMNTNTNDFHDMFLVLCIGGVLVLSILLFYKNEIIEIKKTPSALNKGNTPSGMSSWIIVITCIILVSLYWLFFVAANASLGQLNSERHLIDQIDYGNLNPFIIILLGIPITKFWNLKLKLSRNFYLEKIGYGLLITALSFICLILFYTVGQDNYLQHWFEMLFWVFLSVGEITMIPTLFALVTRVAPKKYISTLLSLFIISSSVTNIYHIDQLFLNLGNTNLLILMSSILIAISILFLRKNRFIAYFQLPND